MRRAAVLGIVVAVAAVAGGCSGDGGGDGGGGGAADAAEATIRTFQFGPDPVEVDAGTTVTWTNEDDILHSVTSATGAFGGDLDGPGSTFGFTFEDPGRYAYVCRIHDGMEGAVVVR